MPRVRLLDIGIDSSTDHYLSRTIKIVNLFSWLTIFGLIFGASNIIFLKSDYPLLPEICFLVFAILSVVLNQQKKYSLAALLTIVNINCAVFFINEYYAKSTGTYLFYFPLIICISLIYSPGTSVKNIVLYYIISGLFLITTFSFDFDFIKNDSIPEASNKILFNYNIIFCISISAVLVFLLIRVINNQNRELMVLLSKEKQALSEKEILLAEIHHRVKNNLAVINSLINLQINSTNNQEAKDILIENSSRILSISKVHEKLYKRGNFSRIDFSEYADELISEILISHKSKKEVKIIKDFQTCDLSISKAIPAGLILNEMMTNCFKHAFEISQNPIISIKLQVQNNAVMMSVQDNGIGFKKEFQKNDQSLGITLMNSLADQIDGKIEFKNNDGARVILSFPI